MKKIYLVKFTDIQKESARLCLKNIRELVNDDNIIFIPITDKVCIEPLSDNDNFITIEGKDYTYEEIQKIVSETRKIKNVFFVVKFDNNFPRWEIIKIMDSIIATVDDDSCIFTPTGFSGGVGMSNLYIYKPSVIYNIKLVIELEGREYTYRELQDIIDRTSEDTKE